MIVWEPWSEPERCGARRGLDRSTVTCQLPPEHLGLYGHLGDAHVGSSRLGRWFSWTNKALDRGTMDWYTDDMERELTVCVPVGMILDRGLWLRVSEMLGISEWAVNEGQIDRNDSLPMSLSQAVQLGLHEDVDG